MIDQLKALKLKDDELQLKRNALLALLAITHQNHCEECMGVGGQIEYHYGSFHEPPTLHEPCLACKGYHPLNITQPMTESEYEVWIEALLNGPRDAHPILAEVELIDQASEALGDEHADLLMVMEGLI